MFLGLDRIAILSKDIPNHFRAFHCDGKRVSLAEMIRTGIVRPVRLHHRDCAEVEIRVTVRAAFRELLDYFCCLTNTVPMDALLVRDDQIRVDTDLTENIDEQRCRGRVIVIAHHSGANIETTSFLRGGLSQFTHKRNSIRGGHSPGVLREWLRRNPSSGAFESGLIQCFLGICQKLLSLLNPRVVIVLINFDKSSDCSDSRPHFGRGSWTDIRTTRKNGETDGQKNVAHGRVYITGGKRISTDNRAPMSPLQKRAADTEFQNSVSVPES